MMYHDVLEPIVDFFISSMGQTLFWGAVTIWTFIYTFNKAVEGEVESSSNTWRLGAAFLITLFWMINISMWFASTMYWMLFSDFAFMVFSFLIFWFCKHRWALHLSYLYAVSFILDAFLWRGLPQDLYACVADLVYTAQLLTVCGWREPRYKTQM